MELNPCLSNLGGINGKRSIFWLKIEILYETVKIVKSIKKEQNLLPGVPIRVGLVTSLKRHRGARIRSWAFFGAAGQ